MKAKSKMKIRRDNETPEKYSSDDSQGNVIDADLNQNKLHESYADLKITEESLQKCYETASSESLDNINLSNIAVRYSISLENQKSPTKRICVLKKAPANVPAIPSSSLLDQNNLRFDLHNRPIQHSILGSVDDYFRMSFNKQKLTLKEIPSEYHHVLGEGPPRRPFSAMFPTAVTSKDKENIHSQRESTSIYKSTKFRTDFDTNALRLWEERMKERKKLQDHISKKVQRVPEKLIFNSAEGFRELMEKRYMISKGIPFHGPGYGFRTGSEFWHQNEEVGIDSQNCLFMTNTQTEKGYPPPILHVGLANKIKEEKGIPFNKNEFEKKSEYYNDRYRGICDVINELDPCQPEFEDLMIMGKQIPVDNQNIDGKSGVDNIQEETKNESLISENFSRSETIQDIEKPYKLFNGPCLSINSIQFTGSTEELQSNSQTDIRMLFNGYAKEKCVEKLCLLNKGTSIIRYWWKKLDCYDPFSLENKNVRRFYFNTEDGILLPNQELNYPIIFKSEKAGIYSEMWKIETLPLLVEGKDIIITLKGVALQKDVLASVRNNIGIYLKYQAAETVCRNILNDIIQNIDNKLSHTSQDETDMDIEKEKFNQKNKGIKFNLDNIHNFKKINQELSAQEKELYEDWDMDCGRLRKNIMSARSLKSIKREELSGKFHKHMDKAVIPVLESSINHRDYLSRICYRLLLDFVGQMYDNLSELRKYHELPEMEMRISNDKKRSVVSRQRTNNSQTSKKQTSASTSKSRSKEPSNLNQEATEVSLNGFEETDKSGSQNILDIEETGMNGNENSPSPPSNPNAGKYHSKTYQVVYSLLDKTMNSIIGYWDAVDEGTV